MSFFLHLWQVLLGSIAFGCTPMASISFSSRDVLKFARKQAVQTLVHHCSVLTMCMWDSVQGWASFCGSCGHPWPHGCTERHPHNRIRPRRSAGGQDYFRCEAHRRQHQAGRGLRLKRPDVLGGLLHAQGGYNGDNHSTVPGGHFV